MYIHLGGEKVIYSHDLIAILNINNVQSIEEIGENRIETTDDHPPKSIIITAHQSFYSSISATTLNKQIKQKYKKL